MRCSRRSTTSCGSAALAVALVVLAAAVVRAADVPADAARAIEAAVHERMGEGVEVRVEIVGFTGTATDGPLVATPEPGARTGRPGSFALTAPPGADGPARRIGSARAVVRVVATHAAAAGPLMRGRTIDAGDVAARRGEVDDVRLEPLPDAAGVAGARVRRGLAAGDVVTADAVVVPPLVQSGQTVTMRARIGLVEATGVAVAQQSGALGDRVRLVNAETRRTLVGQVSGPGEVEVVDDVQN